MAGIKYRLRRRRQNGFVQKVDLIDLTDESAEVAPKFIEVIDLTGCDIKTESAFEPERLDNFRQNLFAAFHKRPKQSMSLLRLTRRVNLEAKIKFSKSEIDSALTQMADANEISISQGLVQLHCL